MISILLILLFYAIITLMPFFFQSLTFSEILKIFNIPSTWVLNHFFLASANVNDRKKHELILYSNHWNCFTISGKQNLSIAQQKGILTALAQLFKHGSREDMLCYGEY